MPQYLSTTQPETLLLIRRLDGYRATNRNIEHPQHQQPNGRLAEDQRRMWRHRSPNTSHQSLRFDEAQRRVKRVEEFKQAQTAFARVLPLRCWSGRLPFARFYRDESMTSPKVFDWKVSPISTSAGSIEDLQTTCSNCSSRISSGLPLQTNPGRTASINGQSSSTQPLQPIPRNLVAKRPADVEGCQSLTSAAAAVAVGDVAETGDDAVKVGVRGRTLAKASTPTQDHLKIK